MKEFVLIEIITESKYAKETMLALENLGNDFQQLSEGFAWDDENNHWNSTYAKFSGKINSESATILALSNPHLDIRISYISDELKDKYRK